MNLVFLQGKIVSKIKYEFIINSKNLAIAVFKVELLNKSIIEYRAYNQLADYSYSKLKKKDVVFIKGYINSNMKIVVEDIIKIN